MQTSPEDIINILTRTKNEYLYFDMETDMEQNMQCFAFSFDGITIYSVPILDYNYHWAYTSVHFILRALAIAIRDNTIVAHNGATFDFFVLAHKYHIPVLKCYDTMIAMHRCYPDIEKSLGNCVSFWTWEKFHKDQDSLGYRTQQQMTDRLRYCAKDVYTMFLVHKEIEAYARTVPGLANSIMAAMRCIRPYLTSTLQGVKVDDKKIDEMCLENDRLMVQYNRMIEILIGEQGLRDIRGTGKVGMFASSPKQCRTYFYELLGYPVVLRSKDTNEPSTGKIALYKLALKHNNPVLTLINTFRGVKKETSRLMFLPWKDDRPKLQLSLPT
jgi:DNA polymerase I-like protein with 3'-5' exonuclease and polymerase domains